MSDRVLVVDDEPVVCYLLKERLQKDGYVVATANSLQEALEEMDRASYAVVLTDIRMEGGDGIALTRQIRSRSPDTEVILVTAVLDVQRAVAALKMGAYDYIAKPFEVEEIAIAVRGALEHRWLKQERRDYQRNLQRKVIQRTRALEEKSLTLARIQRDISRKEKLSSIGVMAASVCHEVNNPLSAMIGFAELLLGMEDLNTEEAREYLELIQQEGERIRRLTWQLLNISRHEKVERKRQDLNPVLEEVLSIIDHHLSRFENLDIRVELAGTEVLCTFDSGQIQQVLLNLLINAAQAMEAGGTLTLQTFPQDASGFAGFSVSDTGTGIPPEIRDQIFEAFVTTRDQSTGLGLRMCDDIVRAHRGEIQVESEPGRGSTFRVLIPVEAPDFANECQAEVVAGR
jgi:signal transduction histidine kinase